METRMQLNEWKLQRTALGSLWPWKEKSRKAEMLKD
jgi:hypothetical protein